MRKITQTLLAALVGALAMTSCSDDDPPAGGSNFISKQTMEGVWVSPLETPILKPIKDEGDGALWNSNDEYKTSYVSYYNYILLGDNKMAAFSNGLYTYGGYNVDDNRFSIPKGSMAIINQLRRTGGFTDNTVSLDDIVIWKAKYDSKKKLVSSMDVTNPMLGYNEKASYINYGTNDPNLITVSLRYENTRTTQYRFEFWQEDAEGNIIDYAYIGKLYPGDECLSCYVSMSDKLFIRVRAAYSNTVIASGYYDLVPGEPNKVIFKGAE